MGVGHGSSYLYSLPTHLPGGGLKEVGHEEKQRQETVPMTMGAPQLGPPLRLGRIQADALAGPWLAPLSLTGKIYSHS